jgi:hypothetical protein
MLNEAYSRLQGLRRAIVELGPGVQYAPSARFLWNLLLAGVDGLIGQLEAAPTGSPALPDLVRGIVGVADTLHVLLSLVEAGGASKVHQAIVPALHELLLKPEALALVCSDWLPSNYSFHQGFPTRVRAALAQCVEGAGAPLRVHGAADAVPDIFAVLSFPVSERDNVFLHASLAHEIGHALVEQHSIPTPLMPAGITQADLTAFGVMGSAVLYQLVIRWCRELVADAWAVCLLGPAPFMSLHSLAPADPPDPQHPASHVRFVLMQECLRRSGFLGGNGPPVDMEWLPEEVGLAIEASATSVTNPDVPAAPLAHRVLGHNVPQIAQFVVELLGQQAPDLFWTRQKWEQGVITEAATEERHHGLVERLLNHCPPDRLTMDGTETIASLAAILNAGWSMISSDKAWARFSEVFNPSGLAGQDRARRKLQALILKAVEIIGVEREWRAAR